MWKQRGRLDWLHDEDKNAKFFHVCASGRRRTNKIEQIQDEYGIWVDGDENIVGAVNTYFSSLFSTSNPQMEDEISHLITP